MSLHRSLWAIPEYLGTQETAAPSLLVFRLTPLNSSHCCSRKLLPAERQTRWGHLTGALGNAAVPSGPEQEAAQLINRIGRADEWPSEAGSGADLWAELGACLWEELPMYMWAGLLACL